MSGVGGASEVPVGAASTVEASESAPLIPSAKKTKIELTYADSSVIILLSLTNGASWGVIHATNLMNVFVGKYLPDLHPVTIAVTLSLCCTEALIFAYCLNKKLIQEAKQRHAGDNEYKDKNFFEEWFSSMGNTFKKYPGAMTLLTVSGVVIWLTIFVFISQLFSDNLLNPAGLVVGNLIGIMQMVQYFIVPGGSFRANLKKVRNKKDQTILNFPEKELDEALKKSDFKKTWLLEHAGSFWTKFFYTTLAVISSTGDTTIFYFALLRLFSSFGVPLAASAVLGLLSFAYWIMDFNLFGTGFRLWGYGLDHSEGEPWCKHILKSSLPLVWGFLNGVGAYSGMQFTYDYLSGYQAPGGHPYADLRLIPVALIVINTFFGLVRAANVVKETSKELFSLGYEEDKTETAGGSNSGENTESSGYDLKDLVIDFGLILTCVVIKSLTDLTHQAVYSGGVVFASGLAVALLAFGYTAIEHRFRYSEDHEWKKVKESKGLSQFLYVAINVSVPLVFASLMPLWKDIFTHAHSVPGRVKVGTTMLAGVTAGVFGGLAKHGTHYLCHEKKTVAAASSMSP